MALRARTQVLRSKGDDHISKIELGNEAQDPRHSSAHFYYNRKTRRSTWTSPTAARTGTWTEHVHVDGGVVYEDDEGNTIEEKPVAFDGQARRPGRCTSSLTIVFSQYFGHEFRQDRIR